MDLITSSAAPGSVELACRRRFGVVIAQVHYYLCKSSHKISEEFLHNLKAIVMDLRGPLNFPTII